jgi:hypothetical protein
MPTALLRLLARQAGVVSRAQAVGAGLAPHEVDRLVARRRLRPLHPRVYLAAGQPLTDEARVRAAVLWAGEGAVLAGLAAAWWHGLVRRPPPTVAVTVGRRCPGPRPGVSVRRCLRPKEDVVRLRGVAVTARPVTVLEAAVEAGAGGAALLDRALGRVVDPDELDAALDRAGRSGTAALLVRRARGMSELSESLQ